MELTSLPALEASLSETSDWWDAIDDTGEGTWFLVSEDSVWCSIPSLHACDFGLIYVSSLNLSLLTYEMRLKFNL